MKDILSVIGTAAAVCAGLYALDPNVGSAPSLCWLSVSLAALHMKA